MSNIAIYQLYSRVVGQLDPDVRSRIKMRIVEISDALVTTIDGDNCISSVSVWSNGCCEVEYLYVATEQGDSSHFEFEDVDSAAHTVIREINMAVERAWCGILQRSLTIRPSRRRFAARLNSVVKPHMQRLRNFLKEAHASAIMALESTGWVDHAAIPNEAGWYFIATDTPLTVLASQTLWQLEYTKKSCGTPSPVRNYDLASRASRHCQLLAPFWNTEIVYSGYASDLRSRAKEHTLPDPGTGALALGRYPELRQYRWLFSYRTLSEFMPACPNPSFMLRLGEQLWRAENGWPLLCAE